jgi:hypothetical protein
MKPYEALVRGQAGICKFVTKCPNCDADVNYTENILHDVLTQGVVDSDIQLDLLSDKNQDITLEDAFQFIEEKEAGKRSAGHLLDSQGLDATRSSYRRNKQQELKTQKPEHKKELCSYCRKQGHGRTAPLKIRKNECPAYGKKCNACGQLNHFETVCRNKDKPKIMQLSTPNSGIQGTKDAIFDTLCTTTDHTPRAHAIALDHHIYNEFNDCCVRQPSKPQPYINIIVTSRPEDYRALRTPNGPFKRSSTLCHGRYWMSKLPGNHEGD